MKIRLLASVAAALLTVTTGAQAALTVFTDYGYTNGTTASWDNFYGIPSQPSYSFTTGSVGNPSNSSLPLTLNVSKTGVNYMAPGNPVGPTALDGDPTGGFYTLFQQVQFSLVLTVSQGTLSTLTFQGKTSAEGNAGGFTQMTLNGAAVLDENTGVNANGANYFTWNNLNLTAGQTVTLSWLSAAPHIAYDAFQLQTNAQVVPEPSKALLLALGVCGWFFRRRRPVIG